MRIFEIAIIIFNLALILSLSLQKTLSIRLGMVFSGLILLMIGAHWYLELPRWQMTPLYCLSGLLILVSVHQWVLPSKEAGVDFPVLLRWISLLVLVIGSGLVWVFPVPSLPKPSGNYKVGTTSFLWVDTTRKESYGNNPLALRKLMIQVWYPANPHPKMETAPYMENMLIAESVLADQFGFPKWVLSHLDQAKTNSYQNAPISQAKTTYPVILFSHGWTGLRNQNTFQMEELASHGYIVIAPDHPYGAAAVIYPDGEVILNDPSALPTGVSDEEYDQAARILGENWVKDLRFVLDQAEKLNDGNIQSIFKGKMDLSRVGILGHSTGGGAAMETCWLDSRCKAGLTMDAWLIPYSRSMLKEKINVPFLLLQSEKWNRTRNRALLDELVDGKTLDWQIVMIQNTDHYDFTDLALFSPLEPLIGLRGTIPAGRGLKIINSLTVAFFDQQLRGGEAGWLPNLQKTYPEIQLFNP